MKPSAVEHSRRCTLRFRPRTVSDTVKNAREMNIRPYPWKAYFEELIQFCGIGFILRPTTKRIALKRDPRDCLYGARTQLSFSIVGGQMVNQV